MQLLGAKANRQQKGLAIGAPLLAWIGAVLICGLAIYYSGVLDQPFFRGVVSAVQSVWSADDVDGTGDGLRTERSFGGGGRRVALVIGNGAYEHVPALENPRNDAEDMAAALRDVGFEVVAGTDLDLAAFHERIGEFAKRAQGAEAALFYYAGHGMQLGGANYLLPVDATQRDEWTLKGTAVKLQEHVLANIGSAARLVFLDACRDNPFLEGIAGGGRSSAASRGLTRVASDSPGSRGGMFIAYATAPGAVAADGDGRNSPFTAALKRHISEPGLEINQMINRVRRTVAAEQPSQTPWHSSSLQDSFYFAPPGDTELDESDAEAARDAWRQISETTNADLLRRFLDDYPNSKNRLAAEGRLELLQRRSFTVVVQPSEARVRILNIGPRYSAGMKLPAGEYEVEASAEGYETATETVAHGATPTVHRIALRKAGPQVGEKFRDCPECPEMVALPAGSFKMGSQEDDAEGPVHEVTIGTPFALGVYEVTVDEFGRFFNETGHSAESSCWTTEGGEFELRAGRSWRNPGFGQSGGHPATCVSWDDAQAYVQWLSRKTGKAYRLPSESEWEYAARAGTETSWYWGEGEPAQCRHANGDDADTDCRDGHVHTAPAGSFVANGWGLHDMLGNVHEWTEDCWNGSYAGSPADGSAWLSGDCDERIWRGGSWKGDGPWFLRAAYRDYVETGYTDDRSNDVGFRIARTLAGARSDASRRQPFTVLVQPSGARVRILNIGPRYSAGMRLPAGEYEVEASAEGYETATETVAHGATPTVHRIALRQAGTPRPTERAFTLDNQSEVGILFVQAGPDYVHDWGADLLGDSVLPANSRREFHVSAEGEHCIFDVRATSATGFARSFMAVDLCVEDRLVFNGGQAVLVDNKSGTAILTLDMAPDFEDAWGGDRLGNETIIGAGDEHVVMVEGHSGHCTFNIRLGTAEGHVEYRGRNLCEDRKIVFYDGHELTVANKGEATIYYIRVSIDHESQGWGDDLLSSSVLRGQSERAIRIHQFDRDQCVFDLLVRDVDGQSYLYEDVNICENDRLVFPPLSVDGRASNVQKHRLVERIEPEYPSRAHRQDIEGHVVLQFTVTATGRVQDIAVVESEPRGVFDSVSKSALRRWRYRPRMEDGEPVDVHGVRTRLVFRLAD